ncbi:hypothetical protein [Photorhabdus laumondii]
MTGVSERSQQRGSLKDDGYKSDSCSVTGHYRQKPYRLLREQ